MLKILDSGLQTTLQAAPRIGFRHFGVPYSGPADPLSMALANRLVGNQFQTTALEITFGGFRTIIARDSVIAVTGADGGGSIMGRPLEWHTTVKARAGDEITINPPSKGVRTYLAIAGGFEAATHFGSTSTYLPAGLGGHYGRTLQAGDDVGTCNELADLPILETPLALRPAFSQNHAIRACLSSETGLMSDQSREAFFDQAYKAGRQGTRMGVDLLGEKLVLNSDGLMKSAPVFPGTIQCPPSGNPIALLCDAQTTGGYPRIASVARCDRHLLGQIRPGDTVQFLHRTPEAATQDYQTKRDLFRTWLEEADILV